MIEIGNEICSYALKKVSYCFLSQIDAGVEGAICLIAVGL